MPKGKPAIPAADLTKVILEGFSKSLDEAFVPVRIGFAKAQAEVDALLAATDDESDIPTLAAYLEAHPPSALALALLVDRVRTLERSAVRTAAASNAATKKHAPERAWVRNQWEAFVVEARGEPDWRKWEWESRDEFAHDFVIKVKAKGVKISARQIREEWLKGASTLPLKKRQGPTGR